MNIPSLRDVVEPSSRGNIARFAEAVGVSWTTAWRWTLPVEHPDHNVPLSKHWAAIERATDGRWTSPAASFGRPKRKARDPVISSLASRKAAATRRRQREARA